MTESAFGSSYGSVGGHPAAHRPPRDCPVCGAGLQVSRLGCGSCGSELSGLFTSCAFCGLTEAERGLLQVFLVSRGNMREVERHLGVSYPTARQRYAELLTRLGLENVPPTGAVQPPPRREDVLTQLARGDIDVDAAADLLRSIG